MDYDPADYVPSTRQVLGAWLACLVIIALVFGAPVVWSDAEMVVAAAHARTVSKPPPNLCQRPDARSPIGTDRGRGTQPS